MIKQILLSVRSNLMAIQRLTIICFLINLIFLEVNQPLAFSLNQQHTRLIHFPVNTGFEAQAIALEAKFEDKAIKVQYVRIYYRVKGSADYQYIEMDEGTENFIGEIPASEVKAPAMEYFLSALLSDQSVVSNPARNPFFAPYEVTITKSTESPENTQKKTVPIEQKSSSIEGTSINFLILNPEPDSKISKDEVVIALSFSSEPDDIDKRSVRLFLDGKNVTRQAKVTTYMISYVPGIISRGKHNVKLLLKDKQGDPLEVVKWYFWVVADEKVKKERKLPFAGRLFFDVRNENITDSTITTVNGGTNFTGRYDKIFYKGSVFITSREKKDQQPRNKFLLEVGTSWIGMRFGDTNPRFNDMILWGKRVRGIEAYVKLGFFNLDFVHGETYRAIPGIQYNILTDPITGDTTWIHPATGDTFKTFPGIYKYGTFKQTLLGIRPSFGRGKKFQLGLNILKVKDDVRSIKYGNNPKDNVVLGPDILLAFDNHRIEFKAGAAFSLITNDISTGLIKKAEIDKTFDTNIPFDPSKLENILILNASTAPLDPSKLTSLAYNMQFKFNYFKNTFRIQYKSIGSEFNSLGNTFLRKNIKGFSISDRIRLLQNQLFLTFGYEQYLDGLDKIDDGNSDTEPTNLKTFNMGISYYPRVKGSPKVSLNIKDHNRNNGLEKLNAISNQTQDISLQLGYDIKLLDLDNTISLSIIGSDRVDDFYPTTSNVAADIRMFTLKTKYQIPLTTTFTFAFNQSNIGKNSTKYFFEYNHLGLNANYMHLNNKLKVNGGLNITSGVDKKPVNNVPEDYTNYKRVAFNIGASYQITSKQYIMLDNSFISFNDKCTSSYNDSVIRLRYEIKY